MKKQYTKPATEAINISPATIIAVSEFVKGEAGADDITLGAHRNSVNWDDEE